MSSFKIVALIFHVMVTGIRKSTRENKITGGKGRQRQADGSTERNQNVRAAYEMPTDSTIKTNGGALP